MKLEDRRRDIVDLLVEEGTVSLDDLALRFSVSKMTIHRDLDDLEAEGLLRKVRGGATIEASGQFESDYRYRARLAPALKTAIARRAADFIEPGMSVMVDDGSTSEALIPFLIEKRPLSVITNNLAVINGLSGQGGISLIALGGDFSKKFNGFFGVLTVATLGELRADIALITSSSIHGRIACHQDQEVLQVKRSMIAVAQKAFLMADHNKFGRTALHKLADLEVFDGVVTSSPLAAEQVTELTAQGIELYFAEEG
ncbi:DeoR/GlpR family DNA-binding transcription regulator [Martelella limonii]|uniref:DeoR/GlpR family DNA-binding transcription regulator n=1 Tax=Martelella limonii TaxID=1647649 RepID=UPI001580C8EE|nr:DeoR/GlpR family DNA-binding transcription regulator [Martelella limonii]